MHPYFYLVKLRITKACNYTTNPQFYLIKSRIENCPTNSEFPTDVVKPREENHATTNTTVLFKSYDSGRQTLKNGQNENLWWNIIASRK